MSFAPPKTAGGPTELGDRMNDTEGRSIFRSALARKDPAKIRQIQSMRGEKPHPRKNRAQSAPVTRALGSDSAANILRNYANVNKDKVWQVMPVQGKFGPAQLGDRQQETAGR